MESKETVIRESFEYRKYGTTICLIEVMLPTFVLLYAILCSVLPSEVSYLVILLMSVFGTVFIGSSLMSKAPYFIWRFFKLDKAALKEYLSEEKEAVTKKIKDAESEI